jgi:hypothetical protein
MRVIILSWNPHGDKERKGENRDHLISYSCPRLSLTWPGHHRVIPSTYRPAIGTARTNLAKMLLKPTVLISLLLFICPILASPAPTNDPINDPIFVPNDGYKPPPPKCTTYFKTITKSIPCTVVTKKTIPVTQITYKIVPCTTVTYKTTLCVSSSSTCSKPYMTGAPDLRA